MPAWTSAIDQERVAAARARFVDSTVVDQGSVRDAILASWRRSQNANIAVDRVDVRYAGDPDLDAPLVQCAEPVLRQLGERLADEPVSILLTNASGVVLSRSTGDRRLALRLDEVSLAPGFTYAEDEVGTNGIGTALTQGRPLSVLGSEHYVDGLSELACFGAPIHEPVGGDLVGLLDLTCWNADANMWLPTIATATAQHISAELRAVSGRRELALLDRFTAVCRSTPLPVIAVNNDVTMANDAAQSALSPHDQVTILDQTAERLRAGRSDSMVVGLEDRALVHVVSIPAWDGAGRLAGYVLTVRIDPPIVEVKGAFQPQREARLSGLVGSGPSWRRRCADALDAHLAGATLLIVGESGVGKSALAHAVHRHRSPGTFACVVDARNAGDVGWTDIADDASSASTVIIVHVDDVPAPALAGLAGRLREMTTRVGGPRVIATSRTAELPHGLRDLFTAEVRLPPLRERLGDLEDLVSHILDQLGSSSSPVRCSPEAMRILLRGRWPGNVAELISCLRFAARRSQPGEIKPEHLPSQHRRVGRRMLSPLESLERDAIIDILDQHGGDKSGAAIALGMSRAAIYRKIQRYGIDLLT